jgi:hypothetical protein
MAPTILAAYIRTPLRAPMDAATSRQPTTAPAAATRPAPAAAVPEATRLVRSPVPILTNIRTEFGERRADTTITAVIARGVLLPRVDNSGRQINMCGRWHLTGQCE